MTLNRWGVRRGGSPIKRSPKLVNSAQRKKALMRRLSSEVQFGAASKANLKVVVRMRPMNQREESANARCVVEVVDDHMLIFDPKEEGNEGFFYKGERQPFRDLSKRQHKEQKFVFERVYQEEATNQQIYEGTTRDIVSTVLDGYNCSVFAYGATGAGKTYTMLGRPEDPGISFLTVMELYHHIDRIKDQKTCEVAISYLEIYNEMVRDLLVPGKPLNVQEVGQQVRIPGLSLHKPQGADQLLSMLAQGNQNRTQHPTDANAESSRSHAVLQVFVRQKDLSADNKKASVCISKLSMIDLAGSERGAATGFKGDRFREGASINKSLLALGNCINALADCQRHIPYRDSKLTRLLKDSLGGNCQSVMIAAISPASTTFEDTFNTLRYANRAKTIKTTVKKNVMNVDQHVANYVKIVTDLKEEISSLTEKVKKYEEKEATWEAERLSTTQQYESRIAALEQQLKSGVSSKPVEEEHWVVSVEEERLRAKLLEVSTEHKALRRELLQLQSSQRETQYRLSCCKARLHRVTLLALASSRLEKSISKSQRMIKNLSTQLDQVLRLKMGVEEKLSANMNKLRNIKQEFAALGDTHSPSYKSLQELLSKNEADFAVRDLQQETEYLRGLAKICLGEQKDGEELIGCLLGAIKHIYIQLRCSNTCTQGMENIFQTVVESLDESKVMWADQQGAGDLQQSGGAEGEAVPDVSFLTELPLLTQLHFSPATATITQDTCRRFRKSCLKSDSSPPSVPSVSSSYQPPVTAEPHTHPSPASPVQPSVHSPEAEDRLASPTAPHNLSTPQSPVLSSRLSEAVALVKPSWTTPQHSLTVSERATQIMQKFHQVTSVSGDLDNKEASGEGCLNATFSLVATEAANTTFEAGDRGSLNETIDLPSSSLPTIVQAVTTAADVPQQLQVIDELPQKVSSPLDQPAGVLNTTVDIPGKSEAMAKCREQCVEEGGEVITKGLTVDPPPASKQPVVTLDSTFVVEEDDSKPSADEGSRKLVSASCLPRSPLCSLENKDPIITDLLAKHQLPQAPKQSKESVKPGVGRPWSSATPGQRSSMRRSVSTSALATLQTSRHKVHPSPFFKGKPTAFGSAVQKASNFLKPKTPQHSNQENLCPGSQSKSSIGVLKNTVSSSAKRSLKLYK